jgi:glycerol-3-phosphate acyltransferase PlsX
MLTIAVDAMGGDHAPKAEVEGAVRAAGSLGVKVILVGQQDVVRRELEQHEGYRELPIEIVHASERVTMEDSAAKAVGPSGTARCAWPRGWCATGVPRDSCPPATRARSWPPPRWCRAWCRAWTVPRWLGIFPTMLGTPVVVVDVGANVDCSPRMLAQFAVMGEIYSRIILHRPKPRVGILSIGEEEHKGNDLTRAAWPLLKKPQHELHRQRGRRDIYAGNVDVIVCDGFTGNVALKVSEGLVDMVKNLLRESLEATISGKIGYALPRTRVHQFPRSAWIIPNTAARRCWACAACASSATALPTPTPSRTPSAWRPSSPAAT